MAKRKAEGVEKPRSRDKRSKYTRALVHELKTPLTSILASSELLESEIKDEIPASLVKNIRRAALNLELRIGELLELARGETGLLKINKIPLDLGGLIREILSEAGPVAAQKNLLLISDIPALPLVYGDKTRLRQVIHHLLSNAVKFTNKGTIAVSARSDDANFVMVQIKDTGRGIEKDQMDNLFDPYRSKIRAGEEIGGIGMDWRSVKSMLICTEAGFGRKVSPARVPHSIFQCRFIKGKMKMNQLGSRPRWL